MGTLRLSAEGAVGRGLSPAIWQAYGFIGGNFNDPSLRPFFFDDFANSPLFTTSTTVVLANGYRTLASNGVSIQNCADCDNSEGEFGILEISGNDASDDEGYIELGGGVNGLVRIDNTAGERAVVAFEARIKRTTVTNGHTGFFLGLAEPAIATAEALVDETHALVDKDVVGFHCVQGSASEIDTVYRRNGAAMVQVKDNAATAVADTWMKLGMVYDPLGETNKKVKFFVDGVELGDSVTDAVIAAATAFPTDEELTLALLTKNETAAASRPFFMDWWAVGSYPVDV